MFRNVTLEMSLKPFKSTDTDFIRSVCRGVFRQWYPLLKDRMTVSVMLWTGDGSEILDYSGDMSESFEWCRFLGTANLPELKDGEPAYTSLHERRQSYTDAPCVMTYEVLKTIVGCIKEEGKKAFPKAVIRVGNTFDIGPEFAISDFKYSRHREICHGVVLDSFGFVDATAELAGDSRKYAAYPNGIPDKTPFGTFLGKQSAVFLKDLGFDFLWLSNGLGFSADPWKKTGKIFDGEKYYPEKLAVTKKKVFDFWRLFRNECDVPLETRGTNNSVGIDYASDGVPLYDIYKADLDITPPPNSPWAALNGNYGLEMMGHMTRICELPADRFMFRYYIHDPWWVNSPWYDRYDGSPCDIYLPMAVSRIAKDGSVESANSLNILSIDNSYGNMPDCCVNEPLPHLLKAEKDSADAPAPLVWVYPMREYTTSETSEMLSEMNKGDHFICDAINMGLPLCCVVSTDNFVKTDFGLYKKSVIISPIPENKAVGDRLSALVKAGVGVIVYGSAQRLSQISDSEGFVKISVDGEPDRLVSALAQFGYKISFSTKDQGIKPPAMAIARRDNGLFFSACNSNTTTEVSLGFPLGAPILCGCETEIKDGCSVYRFSRAEHRECRVFLEQSKGLISCREAPPVNAFYRRAIKITGLSDATVRLFPEKGCGCAVSTAVLTDHTPKFDSRFVTVEDESCGVYLEGRHISGDIYFLMEKKEN